MKKLHLGCFASPHPGWLNTDITPHILISRIPFLPLFLFQIGRISQERYAQHRQGIFKEVKYLDIRQPFPFRDDQFEAVFCSHVLEHLYRDEARVAMREVFRTMVPNGVFRVAVPDLDQLVATYDPHGANAFCEALFESQQSREKNQHHWMYNERSLTTSLREAGFRETHRCQFRQGRCPDVETLDNRQSSLFIEAVK